MTGKIRPLLFRNNIGAVKSLHVQKNMKLYKFYFIVELVFDKLFGLF